MTIELKGNINLDTETNEFFTTIYDKVFTCKTHQGLLKSVAVYIEQIESRQSLRDELVPVYKIGSEKEFLYHEDLQHIYVINVHDKLTRVGNSYTDVYFEDVDKANDLDDLKSHAERGVSYYSELARGYHNDLMDMSAKVKPYKKKGQ